MKNENNQAVKLIQLDFRYQAWSFRIKNKFFLIKTIWRQYGWQRIEYIMTKINYDKN